ncbi:MAG TPA: DinB family protein [Mucilaginibacter sp.]
MMLYPSLISRLKDQHASINRLIEDLDDTRMTYRSEPGKWNIHDNITHLAVYQPVMINRVKAMLEKENPVFDPYKADNDEIFIAWRQWPTHKLLSTLYTDRETLYQLVTNLSKAELNRTGIHLKFGKMTIVRWVEFFLLHEAHHQFSIFRLVQSS